MQTSAKILSVLAVAALVAGSYVLGLQQGGNKQETASAPVAATPAQPAPPAAAPAPAAPAATGTPTAAGTPAAAATSGQPPTPGAGLPKLGPIDPNAPMPANHPSYPPNMTAGQGGMPAAVAPVQPGALGKFNHFRVGSRNVKDMLVDGKHVWIGTSGGVIRFDTEKEDYELFDARKGSLLANGVFHVGKVGKFITVGTYGGGFSVHDPATGKWETFNIPHGLADAFVYDMEEMDNGDVWIATWSGANRVLGGAFGDRSKWETYTVENTKGGLPNDWVYGLAKGKNGEMWMATEGGLARFKDGAWEHWTHEQGVGAKYEQVKAQGSYDTDPAQSSSHHARQKQEQGLANVTTAYNPNYIISLEVDEDGSVWCGTWGAGLAHFKDGQWSNVTVAEGLPSNHIFMLFRDPQNRLWAGTGQGLAMREPDGKFKSYSTADGLFANNVFSMAIDNKNGMWVGSFGGVARFESAPK